MAPVGASCCLLGVYSYADDVDANYDGYNETGMMRIIIMMIKTMIMITCIMLSHNDVNKVMLMTINNHYHNDNYCNC